MIIIVDLSKYYILIYWHIYLLLFTYLLSLH